MSVETLGPPDPPTDPTCHDQTTRARRMIIASTATTRLLDQENMRHVLRINSVNRSGNNAMSYLNPGTFSKHGLLKGAHTKGLSARPDVPGVLVDGAKCLLVGPCQQMNQRMGTRSDSYYAPVGRPMPRVTHAVARDMLRDVLQVSLRTATLGGASAPLGPVPSLPVSTSSSSRPSFPGFGPVAVPSAVLWGSQRCGVRTPHRSCGQVAAERSWDLPPTAMSRSLWKWVLQPLSSLQRTAEPQAQTVQPRCSRTSDSQKP